MPSIYLAAPLFTEAERSWNGRVAAALRAAVPSVTVTVPQEFCSHLQAATGAPDYGLIFAACRDHLAAADIVVAVLDGADADSGTAWELGFAAARGLICYGLRTDWRPAEDGAANCMLSRSCRGVYASIEALIEVLSRDVPEAVAPAQRAHPA